MIRYEWSLECWNNEFADIETVEYFNSLDDILIEEHNRQKIKNEHCRLILWYRQEASNDRGVIYTTFVHVNKDDWSLPIRFFDRQKKIPKYIKEQLKKFGKSL